MEDLSSELEHPDHDDPTDRTDHVEAEEDGLGRPAGLGDGGPGYRVRVLNDFLRAFYTPGGSKPCEYWLWVFLADRPEHEPDADLAAWVRAAKIVQCRHNDQDQAQLKAMHQPMRPPIR